MKESGENNHLLPERKEISSNSSCTHDLQWERWSMPAADHLDRKFASALPTSILTACFCLSILCFFRETNQVESTVALYELITQLKGVSIP